MHALLGSFNSGNYSDSDDFDRTGLSCHTITRNWGAISGGLSRILSPKDP